MDDDVNIVLTYVDMTSSGLGLDRNSSVLFEFGSRLMYKHCVVCAERTITISFIGEVDNSLFKRSAVVIK